MKRALVLAAAAVVLASNVWALISTRQNQTDAPGGTVELTERELRLPPMIGDSTAILLDPKWDVYASDPKDRGSPDWLDAAKLAELGYDCQVPVTSPDARRHYSAMLPTQVYVVLEYEGEAWKRASRDRHPVSRLFAVDAGRDAHQLRAKYPDIARYVITQGVVRLRFQDRSARDGTLLAQPRLRGWIEMVLPERIFVPQPYSELLQGLRRRDEPADQESEKTPRFAVTVSWGSRHEPWIRNVRLLPAGGSEPGTH